MNSLKRSLNLTLDLDGPGIQAVKMCMNPGLVCVLKPAKGLRKLRILLVLAPLLILKNAEAILCYQYFLLLLHLHITVS